MASESSRHSPTAHSPSRYRDPRTSARSASSTKRHSAFARRICVDRAAVHLQQPRARDEVREAPRPRDGDVQPVPREQELEAARHVLPARARHRVDDDVGLLPLELVDRPDARRPPAAPRASAFTCALYGETTSTSLERDAGGRAAPRRARAPPRPPRPTPAGCPSCSTGTYRSPVPSGVVRAAVDRVAAAAAPRRTRPRCSRRRPGGAGTCARGRGRGRAAIVCGVAEQPRQHRRLRPGRVRALDHLRELLRIADQDDVPRRTCPSRARRRATPGRPRR